MSSATGEADVSGVPAHEMRRLEAVAGDDTERLTAMVSARLDGTPLQYLEGTAAFGPLDLRVDERVLIPRPETEQLFELVLRLHPNPSDVIDLCTGSGALALAIAHARPQARVRATDISPDALQVARRNADENRLSVSFSQGDGWEAVAGGERFDLIVSNPPYVTEGEWPSLPVDVQREPRIALVGGSQGTEVIARLVAGAGAHARSGALLALEVGETQTRVVASMLEAGGWTAVEQRPDLAGRPRFVLGRWPA